MAQRIHDKIREALENTPGLTQKGLAERMGLNPAAVNRMLYGRRNIMAEEIPIIENYLGMPLNLSPAAARRGFSDVPAQALEAGLSAPPVPAYGYAAGGLQKNLNLAGGEAVDWVTRHPAQFGIRDAFALYVFSDTMAPRYFRGELVYVHPGRPPEINRDCVIEMKNGEVHIKRFLRQSEQAVRVAQFNPPAEKDISLAEIKALYAIVGRG